MKNKRDWVSIIWYTVIIVGWLGIISASWYFSFKKHDADLALINELHSTNQLVIKLIDEMQEERKFYGLHKESDGQYSSDLRDEGMHLQRNGQERVGDDSMLETEYSDPE